MDRIKLDTDEYLITECEGVSHSGDGINGSPSGEIALTNKHVIYIRRGFFGNVKEDFRYALERIRIINGMPQVFLSRREATCLHLVIGNIEHEFEFDDPCVSKKWLLYLHDLFGTEPIEIPCRSLKCGNGQETMEVMADIAGSVLTALGVKNRLGAFNRKKLDPIPQLQNLVAQSKLKCQENLGSSKEPETTLKTVLCPFCGARVTGILGQGGKCEYCESYVDID